MFIKYSDSPALATLVLGRGAEGGADRGPGRGLWGPGDRQRRLTEGGTCVGGRKDADAVGRGGYPLHTSPGENKGKYFSHIMSFLYCIENKYAAS